MAYEAFFRTMNDASLQRYFLAAHVDSIEVAVEMSKAYYQMEAPQGADFTTNQVEDDGRGASQPAPPVL